MPDGTYRDGRGAGRVPGLPEQAREVAIEIGPDTLAGTLSVPARARGLVVFAHGTGSSRHSPRNRAVAIELNGAKLSTLLLDLLTPDP